MIVRRAEQLRELVNTYKDAAGSAAEAQRLTNTLQAIQGAVGGLERSQPALEALSRFSLIADAPSLNGAKQLVDHARAACDGSARAFVGTEDCGRLLTVLKTTADEIGTRVVQAWQDFSTSNQQNVPGDLLAALALVDAYRETAQRAQRAADRLKAIIASSGPVPTAAQIQGAVEAREELESALTAIQDSVPPRVQAALRRCMSRDGIPLDEVSEEFREWIRTNKIERSFVIRIR
jgi:hypothetical protein